MHDLLHTATSFLAEVPDFGGGEAPPGAERLLKVGRWVMWGVTFLCVVGFLFIGAKMVNAHRHGELEDQGKKLGIALFGVFIIGSATGIVGALLG
ncbi:hypothetical protein GCM10012275_60750 [Longimycelium tulufanense]|uniref:Uncharacterized protein n=2 Tax=Longimycelium tulufanense TaxID=907463 RepID=A0A8J3CIF0_9PSEU|nr:hypothetical protein GCM10012275_60750 [Longimycelium tulufanense]